MELTEYRARWESKPVLRAIYLDYYQDLLAQCAPGSILEIGGGSGNLKRLRQDVLSADIQFAPWLDVVADAQRLPFADQSFDNLVLVDVLHHIQFPVCFFEEATRVLRPNGRIVALEPAITPVSGLFYRLFHDEPVDMAQDPFLEGIPNPSKDPFDANQAIPTLMFLRKPNAFLRRFPQLKLVATRYKSLFAYPLSGGFKSWSLIPRRLVDRVLTIEDALLPHIGAAMAFRLVVVIERRPGSAVH